MVIFPEGTRSHLETPDMLPFKKGAFHLAIQSQYPITPIVIENYSHLYSSRRMAFPGGEIQVRILEPIPTTGMTTDDLETLMERTRSAMLQHLKEMAKSSSTPSKAVTFGEDKLSEKGAVALGDKENEDAYHEGFKKRRTGLKM